MSPWAPTARKCRNRSAARGIESGRATPTASKPWARAASASAVLSAAAAAAAAAAAGVRSRGWRSSATAAGRAASRRADAERGSRFYPRVPGLGALVFVPWHIAQIIDDGQVRRRGQIGIGQAVAGKPVALADEPADIRQMVSNIAPCRPHGIRIGRAAPAPGRDKALVDALHHQCAARLREKLVVEPAHQAADLDAFSRFARHEPELGDRRPMRLVEIFGDDGRPRNRRHAFFDQDRGRSRGIEREKFLAPLPDPLLDEPRRQAELLEDEPHGTGMRTERMMKQRQHAIAGA